MLKLKETLESEIKVFAIGLPYWAKYLAKKILSGNIISENEIDNAYSYLLEELKLIPKTEKSEIVINYNANNSSNYKHDLLFMKLENIEGVNALVENQVIEFSPNLTVIYGANGSGKSGYVRLLKKVFYSKTPEEIISNIYLDSGHKAVKAEFTFKSNNTDIHLLFPADSSNSEFDQYAVFDGKSVIAHLDRRNEFKFRPAGLSFFADLTEAIKRVEEKLNVDVTKKQIGHSLDDLVDLFEGESDIKTIIQNLSAQTKLDDLRKYTPLSEEDKTEKSKNEKKYDNLLLAIKGKKKEIQSLESIRRLIEENKKRIETLNKFLKIECLTLIKNAITDCVNKEETAKSEGIENFKTDKIEGIGSIEWKKFIVAAEHFAKKQKEEDNAYPKIGDNCLLCHQPLSEKAQKLINNYWAFIKSVAEENAKKAQAYLDKISI
jgi:energy-coupling factor transporter ATP-binding protein EcfA2